MLRSNRKNELTSLTSFPREEFIRERWDYKPGEHVTFLGSTGSGKTTLGFELLQATVNPKLPAIVLVAKPRDPVIKAHKERFDFKMVRRWPPPLTSLRKPPGWILWPRTEFDPEKDESHFAEEFRKAILWANRHGNNIIFADDVFKLIDLGLSRELVMVWSTGRSMGSGLWVLTQKPSHIPLWAYNQAEHLFLAYEADERGRKRFAEIGGISGVDIETHVSKLKRYEWLYIKRTGLHMCVILP